MPWHRILGAPGRTRSTQGQHPQPDASALQLAPRLQHGLQAGLQLLPSPASKCLGRLSGAIAAREAGGSYFYTVTSEGLEVLVPNSANHKAAINNGWAAAETDDLKKCSVSGSRAPSPNPAIVGGRSA